MKRCTAFKTAIGSIGLATLLNLPPAQAQSGEQRPASSASTTTTVVPPEQFGAWLQYIASELRAIRAEVFQLRLASQESRIDTTERELQKVRQKQTELQVEESQRQQQIAEANTLSEQQLDPDQRAQLEAVRTELAGSNSNRLRTERVEAAAAEAQLLQRLQSEKLQREQLQAVLKQMTGAPAQ